MYKKLLLICFVASALLNAKDISKEDMLKASIVKLIDITEKLEKRVSILEKELQQVQLKEKVFKNIVYLHNGRKYKEMGVKTPSLFIPKNRSFIRALPYPKADKVNIAVSSKQYQITQLACYEKVGFWGKTQSGWIYISNPKYGKLIDNKDNYLPKDYDYWCKK